MGNSLRNSLRYPQADAILSPLGEDILVKAIVLQFDVGQADHCLDLVACALGQLVNKHRLDEGLNPPATSRALSFPESCFVPLVSSVW